MNGWSEGREHVLHGKFSLPSDFDKGSSPLIHPYSRYELTPPGRIQPSEKVKIADDIEVGLPNVEGQQPHSRLSRYMRSLRSTLRRGSGTTGSL